MKLPEMNGTRTRYRGAQPFADDPLSRRTFFGRDEATVSLTDQILASRLVVVFAKSGLGKSSLLNAGVAPRLREAGCQPLLVRVNDVQQGPLASVLQGIRAEVQRQGVEYVDGDAASLWAFFKTVELWRGDLLLQPVLVIDQFEELFTLHGEAARDALLEQLGHLVRGVPPPTPPGVIPAYSDAPPAMHIVLSLREDFLGILEDASDRIPQIMDHRFRLGPLSRRQAADAMIGPAALADAALGTPPFVLEPRFVDTVLDVLTAPAAANPGSARRTVEPFHLQLICRRAEQMIAAAKTGPFTADRPFRLQDFGGEAALASTLTSFYTDAIQSISEKQMRAAARRLCEEFLISPEGRRLSLEEREIRKQLKLSEKALRELVEARLLRTDRRSDSTYYELGHDALVEPVLATRRTQALFIGWVAMVFGMAAMLACALMILAISIVSWTTGEPGKDTPSWYVLGIVVRLFTSLIAFWVMLRIFKAGMRARKRYGRRPTAVRDEPIPTLVPLRDRIIGRALKALGLVVLLVYGLGTLVLVPASVIVLTGGTLPEWLRDQESETLLLKHPMVEAGWLAIEMATMLLFGAMLWRVGRRRLMPAAGTRLPLTAAASAHWLAAIALPALRRAASAALFVIVLVGGYAMLHCALASEGKWPAWLMPSLFYSGFHDACEAMSTGAWDILAELALLFIAALSLSARDTLLGIKRLLRRLRARA